MSSRVEMHKCVNITGLYFFTNDTGEIKPMQRGCCDMWCSLVSCMHEHLRWRCYVLAGHCVTGTLQNSLNKLSSSFAHCSTRRVVWVCVAGWACTPNVV
jgi:hypothetical protein